MASSALGIVPERLDSSRVAEARKRLDADGAVVIAGHEPTMDATVLAAAGVLGAQLRQLFPVRKRQSHDGGPVRLHADSFDLTVETAGVKRRRRDPDEDYVAVQCVQPPSSGGESFLADAYRFTQWCAGQDPALWRFLTESDVDLYGAWAGTRGLPAAPFVTRHVEYTRTGRRIVRRNDGAIPLHRDPDADQIAEMLEHFTSTVRAVEDELPRFSLSTGDVLLIDNYRCWHGRDGHTGPRAVHILTMLSAAAR